MDLNEAKRAVVTVDGGCGFVVDGPRGRLVITAAHCLPHFPPALGGITANEERSYLELLARFREEPAIMAECLFVDPIADVAILGQPDNQEFYDEAAAYDDLTEELPELAIADAAKRGPAWLLSLEGEWFRCEIRQNGGPLWIFQAAEEIVGGMSGSPILNDDGAAIGMVCASGSIGGEKSFEGGPNPRLVHHLPGWLLQHLRTS